eukprot:3941252-Prymnesium_polylepis.1
MADKLLEGDGDEPPLNRPEPPHRLEPLPASWLHEDGALEAARTPLLEQPALEGGGLDGRGLEGRGLGG